MMGINRVKLNWKHSLTGMLLSGMISTSLFASGLDEYSWKETEELLHKGREAKPHILSLNKNFKRLGYDLGTEITGIIYSYITGPFLTEADRPSVFLQVASHQRYDHAPAPELASKDLVSYDFALAKMNQIKRLNSLGADIEVNLCCSEGAEEVHGSWKKFWDHAKTLTPESKILMGDFALHRAPFDIVAKAREMGPIEVTFVDENVADPIFELDGRISALAKADLKTFTVDRLGDTRTMIPLKDKGFIDGKHQYQVIARDSKDRPFYVIVNWEGLHLHLLAGHFCECTSVSGDLDSMRRFVELQTLNAAPDIAKILNGVNDEELFLIVPGILRQTSTSGQAPEHILRSVSDQVGKKKIKSKVMTSSKSEPASTDLYETGIFLPPLSLLPPLTNLDGIDEIDEDGDE